MAKRSVARVVLLATALVLIGAGLAQGDWNDVLMKATRICMECIGIG